MSDLTTVNDQTFEQEVIHAGQPVLVDFWAPWCGPCRMLSPIIEELSKDYKGRVKVVKINTDESPQVSTSMGIRSIPSVLLFEGRDVADSTIGARPKEHFEKMLNRHLKKSEKKRAKQEKKLAASA